MIVQPPAPLPQDLFLDFDAEEMEPVNGGGMTEGGERDGAVSPQFSTTSTVSGLGEIDNDTSSNDVTLERNEDRLAHVHQSNSSGKPDDDHITMETAEGVVNGKKENVVAMTTGTWERFEPAPLQSSWETFEHSAEDKGSTKGATAKTPEIKPIAQSEDGTEGTVCAADALVSMGWTAMGGEESMVQGEVMDDNEPNLPYRLTRSMRATTNRKVQIVDALKQQRRLSNTSLDRDPSSRGGGGPFANEDELSRRYNVEREWQVFVKMNKKVPGTR